MKRKVNLSRKELSKIISGGPKFSGGGNDLPDGPVGNPRERCLICHKPIKECGCLGVDGEDSTKL